MVLYITKYAVEHNNVRAYLPIFLIVTVGDWDAGNKK